MGPQIMQIRYSDGSQAECIIIRLAGRTIRAVVAGDPDTVEFRLVLDDWVSDRGEVVSFEFLGASRNLCQIMPVGFDHTAAGCAAGGDCMLRRIAGSAFESPAN